MEITENYNIRKYNTFNIDVNCKYFIQSDRISDFVELFSKYELDPAKLIILGGGSNFLFTGYFDGTILYPTMQGIAVVDEDADSVCVRVGAGVVWDDFVAWAVERGYGGVENLSYIPGHVGAAPIQNVGAYGAEAKDTIERVEAIDILKAKECSLSKADCEFDYRYSRFKGPWKNRFLITYVTFRLSKYPVLNVQYGAIRQQLEKMGGELSVATLRRAIIAIRKEKLPEVDETPNAGSFFKNPILSACDAQRLLAKFPDMPHYDLADGRVKLAAGWLIEQAGWKGKSLGNAGVHSKQALVLVNNGNATGAEVAHLANEIKKDVFLKFGVFIDPEVYVI